MEYEFWITYSVIRIGLDLGFEKGFEEGDECLEDIIYEEGASMGFSYLWIGDLIGLMPFIKDWDGWMW